MRGEGGGTPSAGKQKGWEKQRQRSWREETFHSTSYMLRQRPFHGPAYDCLMPIHCIVAPEVVGPLNCTLSGAQAITCAWSGTFVANGIVTRRVLQIVRTPASTPVLDHALAATDTEYTATDLPANAELAVTLTWFNGAGSARTPTLLLRTRAPVTDAAAAASSNAIAGGGGAIAGIVIGIVVFLILVLVVLTRRGRTRVGRYSAAPLVVRDTSKFWLADEEDVVRRMAERLGQSPFEGVHLADCVVTRESWT